MSTATARSFSALVVGEGPMPMQCAHMLRRAGHRVVGVVTPDDAVRAWAGKQGIPTLAPGDDITSFAREHAYDYLFSVVNYALLPDAVLRSARVAAINYHDGPLPRYAGVYVTSWAMMNGESRHGVTWHVMVEEADAGDVLAQVDVPIADTDTATSLNRKCYEAAVKAFGELVKELAEGRETPRRQDLTQRTYFGMRRRPPGSGLLDWTRPAVELDRMVRALTFGNQWNPLATPKVALPTDVFAVSALAIEPRSGGAPGTLVGRTDDGFTVATATDDVVVRGLRTVEGVTSPVDAALGGLRAGDRIPSPDATSLESLHAFAERMAAHERFWLRRLAGVPRRAGARDAATTSSLVPWPEGRLEVGERVGPSPWVRAFVDAARDQDGRAVLGVATADLHAQLDAAGASADALFAAWVPLVLAADEADVDAALAAVAKRVTFPRDLLARAPELRADPPLAPGDWCRISLLLGSAPGDPRDRALPGTGVVARVADDGGVVDWWVDERVVTLEEARRLRAGVERALPGRSATG